MKKSNAWTDEENAIVTAILKTFGGSPSRAYEKHPDWKTKLESKHTTGAIYAKIHTMKGGAKKHRSPVVAVTTTPRAAQGLAKPNRLLVVRDGEVQVVTCPNCDHEFKVMQAPAY
jgi:hypothetical protein